MSTLAVNQNLALCSYAVEATALSKRVGLQAVRSWSEITAATFSGDRPWPWTMIDVGLDSAESFVTAQLTFARSVLGATAEALGVVPTKGAPRIAGQLELETVAARASETPRPTVKVESVPASASKPPVKVETAAAPASASKPPVKVETAAAPASAPKPAVKGATATPAPDKPNAPTKTVAAKPKGPKASGDRKRA